MAVYKTGLCTQPWVKSRVNNRRLGNVEATDGKNSDTCKEHGSGGAKEEGRAGDGGNNGKRRRHCEHISTQKMAEAMAASIEELEAKGGQAGVNDAVNGETTTNWGTWAQKIILDLHEGI